MNKINIDQITVDAMLEELGEDYIFYQKDIGFVLMWEDFKEYCNSLVAKDQNYVSGRGVGVRADEDEPSIELLHIRDIKQMVIQLQGFQDSRYSALLQAIATNRKQINEQDYVSGRGVGVRVEGEYGYLADEIERRILAMFDNEEPHKFYDDTVLPFIREQLSSKKAVRFAKETRKLAKGEGINENKG